MEEIEPGRTTMILFQTKITLKQLVKVRAYSYIIILVSETLSRHSSKTEGQYGKKGGNRLKPRRSDEEK